MSDCYVAPWCHGCRHTWQRLHHAWSSLAGARALKEVLVKRTKKKTPWVYTPVCKAEHTQFDTVTTLWNFSCGPALTSASIQESIKSMRFCWLKEYTCVETNKRLSNNQNISTSLHYYFTACRQRISSTARRTNTCISGVKSPDTPIHTCSYMCIVMKQIIGNRL